MGVGGGEGRSGRCMREDMGVKEGLNNTGRESTSSYNTSKDNGRRQERGGVVGRDGGREEEEGRVDYSKRDKRTRRKDKRKKDDGGKQR